MSRLLILGAGGMLGHKLCQRMPAYGHSVVGTVRKDISPLSTFAEVFRDTTLLGSVDVLNESILERTIRETKPDFVINCVGIVKQRQEAEDAFISVAINSYLPHKLARVCSACSARLIHISTDCVFDGARGDYGETDFSDARDLYGKSKFLGETTAAEESALTLRTSFIGRELQRPTHGLVEWFLTQKGKTVKGFARAIYTGFTAEELTRIIALVIGKYPMLQGLFQVASAPINKFDLLNLVRNSYGLDVSIERDEEFACNRSLRGERFGQITGYAAPSWPRMVQQMHDDSTPYDAWFSAV